MSQKKVKTKRQQVQEIKQHQNNKYSPKLSKLFSWGWKIFAAFAIVLGVYSALHPKISVSPSTYLNPSDPLKALFEVTNNGFMSLYDVQPSCALIKVTTKRGLNMVGAPDYKTHLVNPSHFSKELGPGETDTVFCPIGSLDLRSPVTSADIAIVVDYSFLGIKWPSKIYPFTTQVDINGQLHWIKHPLKK